MDPKICAKYPDLIKQQQGIFANQNIMEKVVEISPKEMVENHKYDVELTAETNYQYSGCEI